MCQSTHSFNGEKFVFFCGLHGTHTHLAVWKNIEKQLLQLMGKLRDIRLKNEWKALLRKRKSIATGILRTYKRTHLPYTQFMPGPADFCAFAPVKDVVQQPLEVQVDESSFSHIVPLLPDLIGAWRTEKLKQLQRHVPSDTAGQEINLHLATSTFICREGGCVCDEPCAYFFPQMLLHPCLTAGEYNYDDSLLDDPPILVENETMGGFAFVREVWNPSSLMLCTPLQTEVKKLVQLAGLEPNKATAEDMDHSQIYFLCTTCLTQGSGHGFLYGWREAVSGFLFSNVYAQLSQANHLLRRHLIPPVIDTPIDEENIEELIDSDDVYQFDSVSWRPVPAHRLSDTQVATTSVTIPEKKWYCAHCFDLPTEPDPEVLGNMYIHLGDRCFISRGLTLPR